MARRFTKSRKDHNRKRKRLNHLRKRITSHKKIEKINKAKAFVKNLSEAKLTDDEYLLLSKGVKFVPTPGIKNIRSLLMKDFDEFSRKLRCQYIFRDNKSETKHTFYTNTGYTPIDSCEALENYIFATKYELSKIEIETVKPNMNEHEHKALRNLKQNKNIIIRKADKNSTLCILDRSEYIKEGHRQLENNLYYEEINQSEIEKTTKALHDIIETWHERKHIDNTTHRFLRKNLYNKKLGKFFLLPKIHKISKDLLQEMEKDHSKVKEHGIQGRPIVSLCGTPFHNLAHFIDKILLPLVQKQNTYIRDTKDFIRKIENLKLNNDILLATFDASNMYTNLDYSEIISSTKHAIKDLLITSYPFPIPPINDIIKAIDIIIKNNEFTFNGRTFRQKLGVPMGGAASAELADIRMFEIFENILSKFQYRNKIVLCGRYRDDGIIIFNGSKFELQTLFDIANKAHPYLKFTYEMSTEKIVFLDTEVYKGNRFLTSGILDIKTYRKPTETFQYLDRKSCHPKSVFKGFIKGEIMRNIRNTSDDRIKNEILQSFKDNLLCRHYKNNEIDTIFRDTADFERNDLLVDKERKKGGAIVFVTKYNPSIKQLKRSVIKHWHLLEESRITSSTFNEKPIIAYKRHKNLQEKLTRADKF